MLKDAVRELKAERRRLAKQQKIVESAINRLSGGGRAKRRKAKKGGRKVKRAVKERAVKAPTPAPSRKPKVSEADAKKLRAAELRAKMSGGSQDETE